MANFTTGDFQQIMNKATQFEALENFVNGNEFVKESVEKIIQANKDEGKEISFEEAVVIAFSSVLSSQFSSALDSQVTKKLIDDIKNKADEIQEEIKQNVEKYEGKDIVTQWRFKGWFEALCWVMKDTVDSLKEMTTPKDKKEE